MSAYVFASGADKGRYLCGAASDDARDPFLVTFAAAAPAGLEGDLLLHRWVTEHLAYAIDPGHIECFDSARQTLRRRWDDCDGLSRTLLAALRARGSVARLRAVLGSFRRGTFPAVLSDDPSPDVVRGRIARGRSVFTLAIESDARHVAPPAGASLRHLQVELYAPHHPLAAPSGYLLLETTRPLPPGYPR